MNAYNGNEDLRFCFTDDDCLVVGSRVCRRLPTQSVSPPAEYTYVVPQAYRTHHPRGLVGRRAERGELDNTAAQ